MFLCVLQVHHVCASAKTHIELFCMTAKVNESQACVHCRLTVSNRLTLSVFNACESLPVNALRCICRHVPCLFLHPDVLPPVIGSMIQSSYPNISPNCSLCIPFEKKKRALHVPNSRFELTRYHWITKLISL